MRAYWPLVAIAILVTQFSVARADNDSNKSVVIGSCNIVQQDVKAAEGSVIINNVHCPLSPQKSVRVKYVWLDAASASFLMSGVTPSPIKQVIGTPQIVQNDVYQEVQKLIKTFGDLKEADEMNPDNQPAFTLTASKEQELELPTTKKDFAAVRQQKTMRILSGKGLIPWPNPQQTINILKETSWPPSLTMQYSSIDVSDKPDADELGNRIMGCTRLYGYLTKEMLDNYYQDLQLSKDLVYQKILRPHETGLEDVFKNKDLFSKDIKLLKYVGDENWPSDFAVMSFTVEPGDYTLGDDQGCGLAMPYTMGFSVETRSFNLLVAVIEPVGDTIDVQKLTYAEDDNRMLRSAAAPGATVASEGPGVITIAPGQSLVIPMRMEFRYGPADYGSDIGTASYNQIVKLPYDQFSLRGVDTLKPISKLVKPDIRTVFSKTKGSFRQPEALRPTPVYIFGPSVEPKSVVIEGTEVNLRKAPASAMTYAGETGLGSCPFLFAAETDDAEPTLLGRVLVGADAPDRHRLDQVTLPPGSRWIYLAELEPEIATIARVSVRDDRSNEEVDLKRSISLGPGEAMAIAIPPDLDGRRVFVEGYYRRLNDVALAASAPMP